MWRQISTLPYLQLTICISCLAICISCSMFTMCGCPQWLTKFANSYCIKRAFRWKHWNSGSATLSGTYIMNVGHIGKWCRVCMPTDPFHLPDHDFNDLHVYHCYYSLHSCLHIFSWTHHKFFIEFPGIPYECTAYNCRQEPKILYSAINLLDILMWTGQPIIAAWKGYLHVGDWLADCF